MKKTLRNILIAILLLGASNIQAQQVNTLYFLENAPMRHTINPAFQPVSKFYLTLPAIGYTSIWAGTNNWAMSDFLFKGPNGQTITPFHPDAPANWLDKRPKNFVLDTDIYTNLLGFGFRIKENGYLHLNVSERVIAEGRISSSIFTLNDLSTGVVGPLSLGVNALAYTDIALGYSHVINRKWTVGGKIKFLLGQAHLGVNVDDLKFATSLDSLHATATGKLRVAAPLNMRSIPNDPRDLADYDLTNIYSNITDAPTTLDMVKEIIKPAGLGVAFDLGVTYKPIEQLQISASVTDLGFLRWHNFASTKFSVDTTFKGIDLEYSDYGDINGFDSDALINDLNEHLEGYTNGIHIDEIEKDFPYLNMLTANLHVGLDANFWKNRVGVGVHSRTRFYNKHVTEEVTLGAAFRPVNWFNLAASYSFINGRWSNLGAAISLAPYDGIMLTLATDYIPTNYAKATIDGTNVSLPYKTPGVNVAFGVAIVAGTNPKNKDKDKDGVWDRIDVCPNTPLNVRVDEMGCPLDADADGVADYLDHCPHTPSAAFGFIDSVGCPMDTDGDGVLDYLDECPDTEEGARGYVNSVGCLQDTDGDGVYDDIDKCPNTPQAAYGMVDSVGCPIDTDNDGVYDYLDLCPDTPAEANGTVDKNGCPVDSDKDGVYDYLDECPNTTTEARQLVDEKGCLLDTDGDGVYDYLDQCPGTPAEANGTVDKNGCPVDSDKDGVYDYLDECPNTTTEARQLVDEKGCLLDTDGDGVYDYLDQCPGTPAEAYGSVDKNGCPNDSDKDGVYDYLDECPNTTIEARQYVDEKGCVQDSDNDGVYDYRDMCQDTPEEARGKVDEKGCPLDTDKDGVPDYMDKCPNTPSEARNFVDSVGCLLDTDGDGIHDYEDSCPTIPGVKANLGCPEIKREIRNLLNKAMSGIEFENNQATIKPSSYQILDQVAQIFIDNPSYLVEVQGHTDNVGKADYNMNLSERRAQAVRTYLVNKGVPASRLTARGYGMTKPIADNSTAAGRAKNRRVEFNITFEEVTYEIIYDRVK